MSQIQKKAHEFIFQHCDYLKEVSDSVKFSKGSGNRKTGILNYFCLTVLVLLISFPGGGSELFAQDRPRPQPLPGPQAVNPPEDLILDAVVRNRFRIAGAEAGVTTYGATVGLPVLWVQDQMKIVPILGRTWNRLPEWSGTDIFGGRILYYANRQQTLSRRDINPFAGIAGVVGSNNEHNIALAAGVEPFFSRYIKLGFEVQTGLCYAGDTDRVFLGAGFTLGLGW